MRKHVFAVCEQQRHRSACASVQSGQHLRCLRLDNIIPLVSKSEISSLCLASVTAQAGLSLPWLQTPKTGFLVMWLKFMQTWDFFNSSTELWTDNVNLQYSNVRRPSVVNAIHSFKLEYLLGQLASLDLILYEASLAWGKGCLRLWGRSDQNSGFHCN